MRCPVCGNKDTRVVDSRPASEASQIRRRRECEKKKCGFRFSTIEQIELLDITVKKRDGTKEPYAREKLLRGLKNALEKRSYTENAFQSLVQGIERDIQKKRTGEITSEELGDFVMKHLQQFDKIAYIRFASVYHAFENIEHFQDELERLARAQRKKRKSTR